MKNRKIKQIEKRFGAARNRFATMSISQLSKVNLRDLSDLEFQQICAVYEKRFGALENETPGFEAIDDKTLNQLCAAIENDGGTVEVTEQQAEFINSLW